MSLAIDYDLNPHYTYEDYKNWEGRWEVIEGIAYAMSPMPTGKHQRLSLKIAFELEKNLKNLKSCKRCKALMPVDWEVDKNTIVQPDNLVVCDIDINFTKLTKTPIIIFEILSPSTAKKDKTFKYQIYEQVGVKYYIIIDPEKEVGLVYELNNFKYNFKGEFKKDNFNFDLDICKIEFDFSEVFGE